MLQQQKRYHKIILLSVLYTVCIISILLAFPKNVGYTEGNLDGVYLGAAKGTSLGLPIQIEWGKGKDTPTTTTTKVGTPTPQVSLPKPIAIAPRKKKVTTCADIDMCNKVHFSEGYTDKQKAQYYSIVLDTISSLQNSLPQGSRISNTLFSLTLSNTIGDRRGWGGSKTIIINTKDIGSIQEFREILTHELGHIIDLGVIAGASQQYDQYFTLGGTAKFGVDDTSLNFYRISRDTTNTRKSDATYLDFVGGYAMSNPYEDFSESFNMYIWHNDVFRAMALGSTKLQKKYNFIQSIIGGLILSTDWKTVSIINANSKRRPWDSTRMSLE